MGLYGISRRTGLYRGAPPSLRPSNMKGGKEGGAGEGKTGHRVEEYATLAILYLRRISFVYGLSVFVFVAVEALLI